MTSYQKMKHKRLIYIQAIIDIEVYLDILKFLLKS